MKNSCELQKRHYNSQAAAAFDKNRWNANHLYKIEVIEGFVRKYCRKGSLRILEVGGGYGPSCGAFPGNGGSKGRRVLVL